MTKNRGPRTGRCAALILACASAGSMVREASATLIAAWDFQTVTSGQGTALAAAPSTPTVIQANAGLQIGTATIYADGTHGSSTWITATSGNQITSNSGTATVNSWAAGVGYPASSATTSGAAALTLLNSSANTKSIVLAISMTGYQDLTLTYATQRTATGFNSQNWHYSTDLTNWTQFANIGSIASSFDLKSASPISAVNNQPVVYLRLTVDGASSGSGNNRFDNIQLNALALATEVVWTGTGAGEVWKDTGTGHFTAPYANSLTNTVKFQGIAETVTLDNNVQAGQVIVKTTGYLFTGGNSLTIGAGGVSVDPGVETTISSKISGTAGLNLLGGGTLMLTNLTNDFQGVVNVSNSTLRVTSNAHFGDLANTITLTDGKLKFDGATISGRAITSSGSSEIITTSGNPVTVGQISGNVIATVEGNLSLNQPGPSGTNSAPAANLSANATGGTWTADVTLLQSLSRINLNSGIMSGGGKIKIAGDGSQISASSAFGSGATVQNEIVLNSDNAPFTFNTLITSPDTVTLTLGVISGNSNVQFGFGNGTLVLAGASTYSGTTKISTSATTIVRLGVDNALPVGTTLDMFVGTGSNAVGFMDLNGKNQTLAGIQTSNPLILLNTLGIRNTSATASTLTIKGNVVSTFGSPLGGTSANNLALALDATNTGTLTLTGASTYANGTTIAGGTLIVANTSGSGLGTGAVNITGGTLGGGGTFTGVLNASGGTLSPGLSVGKLTTGSESFASGSTSITYKWEISDLAGAPGTGFDQLFANGALDFSALNSGVPMVIDITALGALPGWNNAATYSWVIIDGISTNGFDPSKFSLVTTNFENNNPLGGNLFSLSTSAGNLVLKFNDTYVPKNLTWDATASTNWNQTEINWLDGANPSVFTNTDSVTFAAIPAAGGAVVVDAAGVNPAQVTFTHPSGTYTFSGGPIGGSGMTLSGGGTVVMNITNNTFLGSVNIQSGTLQIAASGSLGDPGTTLFLGSASTSGTLQMGASMTLTRAITVAAGGGTIDTNGFSLNLSPAGAVTLNGTLTKSGAGTLQMTSGGFTGTAGISVTGGTLIIGANTPVGTYNSATLMASIGTLSISNATVQVGGSSANNVKIQPSQIVTSGNANLTFYHTSTSTANVLSPSLAIPMSINGGTFTFDVLNVGGANNTNRLTMTSLNVTAPATIKTVADSTHQTNITFTAGVTDNGNALTFFGGGSATQVPGTGIFINSTSSVMTGDWNIGNAGGTEGVLLSTNSTAGLTTGAITVHPYGNLTFFNGNDGATFGSGAQTINLNGIGAQLPSPNPDSSGALRVDSSGLSANLTTNLASHLNLQSDSVIWAANSGSTSNSFTRILAINGNVSGSGVLRKQGTGTVLLNGTVSNVGGVIVANGVLGGTGTINGPVSVEAAGTIAPGASIGTLTVNNTLSLAGISAFEINDQTSAADKINLITNITFGGTLNVTNLGAGSSWVNNQTFELFGWSGTPTGTFTTINLPALPSGFHWKTFSGSTFNYVNGQIVVEADATGLGAGSGSWNNGSSDNNWTTNTASGSNWLTAVPNGAGHVATFAGSPVGGPGVVNMGGNKTVGGLIINATSGYSIGTPATSDKLIVNNSGSGFNITATGNTTHTVNAQVVTNDYGYVTANAGATLVLAQGIDNSGGYNILISGPGKVVSGNIDGPSGTTSQQLAGNAQIFINQGATVEVTRLRTGTLNIGESVSATAGTLKIVESSPTSTEQPSRPSGNNDFVSIVKEIKMYRPDTNSAFVGTIDITNNDIIIDYTDTGISPLSQIEEMVKSGYNNGTWTGTGITSSVAAAATGLFTVAVADNQQLGGVAIDAFDGVDTSNHKQILIKFTWIADINLDGLVNSNDAIAFATFYSEGLTGVHHQTDDLNYDGVVNSNDAILFATTYNAALLSLPEPTTLGMLAMGAAGLLMRRRR